MSEPKGTKLLWKWKNHPNRRVVGFAKPAGHDQFG